METCVYGCPDGAHDLRNHRGLACGICGEPVTWFNDVPLRGFCWGDKNGRGEHREWSKLVPAKYNPYLPTKHKPAMDDEPICDICGRGMTDSPNVMHYGPATEADWNGETGNHAYCETPDAVARPTRPASSHK